MLRLKPFKQSASYCGPASLKIVLAYFGIKKSEKELARLSGSTKEKGVGAAGLVKAAKKLGLKAFVKDFSALSDIKKYVLLKKVPVIVDWFAGEDGHYSVAVHIDQKNIYLQDPDIGKIRKVDLVTFKRVWFDFPGNFLKTKKDLVIRRMVVAHR